MRRNPLFAPQARIDAKKFKDVRYGLEVDVTGRGGWVEQGLYDTRAEAEKDGRAIKKREGMPYHVKVTRDVRNTLTDRAKRYRAQKNKPAGPKICGFCGHRRNIDVDHITGDEADGEPENLMYLCRPCNTRKGIVQARNRIGVRTRQYNPRRYATFEQWKHAARVMLGVTPGDVAAATEQIRATSPGRRADYAARIEQANPFKSEAQRKKFFAMASRGEISKATLDRWIHDNPAAPTFKQYLRGIHEHTRGAHDEGGKIIHATPRSKRREYAGRIADFKRQRGGEVPF